MTDDKHLVLASHLKTLARYADKTADMLLKYAEVIEAEELVKNCPSRAAVFTYTTDVPSGYGLGADDCGGLCLQPIIPNQPKE